MLWKDRGQEKGAVSLAARITSCRREGDVECPETSAWSTLAVQPDVHRVWKALLVTVLAWKKETAAAAAGGSCEEEEDVLGKRRANAPLLPALDAKQTPFIFP